jgi:hypothetical protein
VPVDTPPDAFCASVHEVAWLEFQLRRVEVPLVIVVGVAVRFIIGSGSAAKILHTRSMFSTETR